MSAFPRPDDATLAALARQYGTPLWVYDSAVIDSRLAAFRAAFSDMDTHVRYAVKANGNLAVLQHFARAEVGFDVVSVGELARVERAGGDPGKTIFSGVGKRVDEIDAALASGIGSLNCESAAELEMVNQRAGNARLVAPISLRVNPGVDALTHPHISTGDHDDKFGIPLEETGELARHAATLPAVKLHGLALHIGSQLTDLHPMKVALERTLALHDALVGQGLPLEQLDAGGGLGIRYRDEVPPTPADLAAVIRTALGERKLRLVIEPGRALVGEAGVLMTRVTLVKPGQQHAFVVVDAGMSELMRPSLYDAWHPIEILGASGEAFRCEVVGPLCESGDVLGRERMLAAKAGDLAVIGCAGAYGASMSSHYNARPRAAEVLLKEGRAHLARAREQLSDLWRGEALLP